MGRPRVVLGPKITVVVVGAETRRDLNAILINEEGPFVLPRYSVDGIHFNFGLIDDDARELFLLHELGHLIGRFEPDGNNAEMSKKYSELVLRSCFQ
jgi:hypothetical protein